MTTTYGNRMRVAVATTGTGTVNLGNSLTNFVNLSSLTTGSTIGYALDDLSNGAWEIGTGTYTSGSPSTVTRVLESSSTGSLLNLSGNAILMVTQTAVQILSYAPLASPALTGTPTAPTAAAGDNTTQIATDAFVTAAVAPAFNDANRNKIHNAYMNIQQRGSGPFTTSGLYTLDRWVVAYSSDTVSIAPGTYSDGNRTSLADEEATNNLTATITGSASAGAFSLVYQPIENVRRLSNRTVTVSFYAHATSGTPKLGVQLRQYFGTGGSPSSLVDINGTAVTLSTTPTRYNVTVTFASISGKTLGTNNDHYTRLAFWFSSGSTNNTLSGSIGQQSATFVISGVQLEIGTVATQLEKLDPGLDLANCQRFYQTTSVLWGGECTNAVTNYASMGLNTTMRAVPTVAISSDASTNFGTRTPASTASIVYVTAVASSTAAGAINCTVTATADL